MIKLIASIGILVLTAGLWGATRETRINGGTVGQTTVTIQDSVSGATTASTGGATAATGTTGGTATTQAALKVVASPKPTVLKELNLSDSRQVYIYGVIDENNSPSIAQQILQLGKDASPINILINSPGGSVLDGAEIISAMQAAKGPVNTVCVQICASMAAMIHSYGSKRLMIDRSLIMFHPATGGVEGEVDKMYSRLGTLKEYIGEMELNAANRAGMSYQDYKFHSGIEMWLPARKAVAGGYADDVVFVRGSESAKLFLNVQNTMRYVNRRLPFVMFPNGSFTQPTNGKFYWISPEAYNMLYGNFPTSSVVTNGR